MTDTTTRISKNLGSFDRGQDAIDAANTMIDLAPEADMIEYLVVIAVELTESSSDSLYTYEVAVETHEPRRGEVIWKNPVHPTL